MPSGVGDFSNTTIGRFHVADLIARGGMGEVYRATDTLLGRELALKVLRPDVTRDPDRLSRFTQEARAASALNHPHLITIYDIGESTPQRDGAASGPPVRYIAMELVSGRTLRAMLDSNDVDLLRLLEYLTEAADALGAAHAAGVIHRDLKPENLMIADEGYTKVLDFGLAKLRGEVMPPVSVREASTSALTSDGMLLGTAAYMSPEQALGQAVDQRTDVFSFGCVLYEAVTGTRAFRGATLLSTLDRVIHEHPAPVAERVPDAPEELGRIIHKCLAKDADARYQTMRDVAHDLRELRKQLELAQTPASTTRKLQLAAAALVVAALVGVLGWNAARPPRAAPTVTVQRLTASGTTIDAALSPDGTSLVWVDSSGGMQSLRMRRLRTDENIELVAPARVGYWGVAFSRDGSRVFYATKSAEEPLGRLFVVDSTGGVSRTLLDGVDSTVTVSPDGRQIAFYRANYPERGVTSLVVADTEGRNVRALATTRPPEFFVPAFFAAPSWSPDATRIAAAVHDGSTGGARLVTIDVASGTIEPFARRFADVTFTSWLPDGQGVLFVANHAEADREIPRQIWLQPFPRGEPHRVTRDLLEYRNISMRADGSGFVAVGLDSMYTLWRIPLDDGLPQRIASDRYDGLLGVAALPDGRIIVSSGERGRTQLALLDGTGTQRRLLTMEGANFWPAVTADGETVAFVSNRDGQTGVWRMNIDGTEPRLLAHLPDPAWLSITADSRHVVVAAARNAEPATWRVPMDGGEPPTLIASGLDRPAISPDGRLVAGINVASGAEQLTLAVVPLDGSAAPRSLGTIAPATGNGLLEWSADGSGIIFSTVERSNAWFQPLTGGMRRQLTKLTDLTIVRGDRTADGRNLIVARGVAQTDAFLITNFR